MAHEIRMGKDGILRISLAGDLDKTDMETLIKNLSPYRQAATETVPLNMLVYAQHAGKFSPAARKTFTELNADRRIGKVVIMGANRILRVLGRFTRKITGRQNIQFFEPEEAALEWLRNSH